MNTLRTAFLALLALSVQACVLDVDNRGRDPYEPRRHVHRVDHGRLGDRCASDFQCSAGLVCFSGSCEPERVGIYVHGALVAPGRADGREWDDDRLLPRHVWSDLDRARRNGVDALFDFMWSFAGRGTSAPDVFGYGYLAIDDRYDERMTIALAEPDLRQRDTFEFILRDVVGWTDVPLHEGLRVAFDLFDYDRGGDESIGLVEIDAWGIHEALVTGGVVWFDTWEATDGQLLLLGIEVISESW